MPLTPEQKAMIRLKEESLSESLRRDPLTDYREGYFHITLNVRDKSPVLGSLSGNSNAPAGSADAPQVELTELGKQVDAVWQSIPRFHPCVELLAFQIMPEHIHGLLRLKPMGKEHLGRVVNGFMIGCTHCYWDFMGIDWRNMKDGAGAAVTGGASGAAVTGGVGAIAHKWQDRYHTRSFRGPALFVRGYNDVEALTPEEVQVKIDYIRSNPERRLIKGQLHDVFAVRRNQKSANWTLGAVRRVIADEPFFRQNIGACSEALVKVERRVNLPDGAVMTDDAQSVLIDYVGDKALLLNPKKVCLICHRADASLFHKQAQAVLDAARDGAVVVSAFISPREREIKKLLLMEQLPVIEVMDNGFSQRYKPYGKSFYACAERRLLQISCWKYLFQKDATVSREQCLVMNGLARLIAGTNEDFWKHK